MDYTQGLIDVLRAAHLVCFAAGMGTGIYFDFRMLRTFAEPLGAQEIANLRHLHGWILLAFTGLWLTGIVLIYVRTSFDLATFSPKLWLKLGLMTLLLLNSILINQVVIPSLAANIGRPMIALSPARFLIVSQIAIISMFCWTSGLMLGSSVVLKTARWEVLLPLASGWFALLTVLGLGTVMFIRQRVAVRISGTGAKDAAH